MFPQKISQNIDILGRIHGNVFPWQPAIMRYKASFYQSIFRISLPWLHLSFHNACPVISSLDRIYCTNLFPNFQRGTPTQRDKKSFQSLKKKILKFCIFGPPWTYEKNSILDQIAEIWHRYSPYIQGLACKILGKLLEAYGRSVTKCPREFINAKFGDFFFKL